MGNDELIFKITGALMFWKKTDLNNFENEEFLNEFLLDAKRQIRIIFVIFVIMFLLDGIAITRPIEYEFIFFIVRYCITIPLILVVVALSYTNYFIRIGQPVLFLTYVVIGFGLDAMLILGIPDPILLGILVLVELAGFLLIRLRFILALLGGLSILLFYIVGTLYFGNNSLTSIMPALILLTGTVVVGILGNKNMYAYSKKNYLQKKQNILAKKDLEKMMSEKVKEIADSQAVTIFALAKLSESRDKETGNHIERVGKYCLLLASKIEDKEYEKRLINKEEFLNRIELASALHDIGKVGVGDAILIKPGKLNAEEFELMTYHTLIGSRTLDEIRRKYPNNSFINMGVEITRCHHEKFDGTGYP